MACWELLSGSGSGHEVSFVVVDEKLLEVVDVVWDLCHLVAMGDWLVVTTLALRTSVFGHRLVGDCLAGESTRSWC